MEGNKDDANKCIRLAENCIIRGEKSQALKLLEKAERMFPTHRAKELISELSTMNGSAGGRGPQHSNHTNSNSHNERYGFPSSQSEPNFRDDQPPDENYTGSSRSKPTSADDSSLQNDKTYTKEQVAAVNRIKSSKDYYDILGIAKTADDSEIKKAYRKLALQFHPDKNHAPGATEAFKAIGKAFAILSDADKRKKYDCGALDEDQPSSSRSARRRRYAYTNDYDDFDADEIFNMFFGGGFPTGNVRTYQTRRSGFTFTTTHHPGQRHAAGGGGARNPAEANLATVIQLLPLILLVLMSFFSSFMVSDPPYNLHRNSKFTVERRTGNLNVVYFVKKDFLKEYSGQVHRVEQHVEEEYINNLRVACVRERNYKENALWRARVYSDAKLWESAQQLTTPSCDKLNGIYG